MSSFIELSFITARATFKDIEELILLTETQKINIDNVNIDSITILKLQEKYDTLLFHQIDWCNTLIIQPAISNREIEINLNGFIKCFKEFDTVAHNIMNLMAKTFGINLENSEELFNLKRNRSEKQRGRINDEWCYHFHGGECTFLNKKTGQTLDVKITHGTEYGVIDTYYLLQFINTTPILKDSALLLDNKEENLQKVINYLVSKETLIELPNQNYRQLLLNKFQ